MNPTQMTTGTVLDELSDLCGIVPQFKNALGEIKSASDDTRRTLLAAMGVKAGSEAEAAASLKALKLTRSNQVLPPVCVLRRSTVPWRVGIRVSADTVRVAWRVELEEGGGRSGEARFEALQPAEGADAVGAATSAGPAGTASAARELRSLALPGDLPCGYHKLVLESEGGTCVLIVTSGKCWLPEAIRSGQRLWGVSAQVYLLRSAADWGIGDYGDLARLASMLGSRGAAVVGLNPLHAMFLDDPEHASPYSPASRLLLNVLNIDVGEVARRVASGDVAAALQRQAFQKELRRCRDAKMIDYSGVLELKLPLLRLLFAAWSRTRDDAGGRAFAEFRRNGGAGFERGILFMALREHFAGGDADHADWHSWPAEFRDPDSAAVARFAVEHGDLVTFHAWLQYVADTQLAAAASAASSMAIGLYRDLAVGADPSGAETWANQAAVVMNAHVGAPPDIYNPTGQDWGLPPFDPLALQAEAYKSFIELIRANMRHAGGLRIDHVMALQQLYWVPARHSPAEGAYVRYPLEDLVGILALESERNECLVVGEDLGTVPEGFRDKMAAANIFSYRVLFFEKDDGGFIEPSAYPKLALAVEGSHDLPTLRAWWDGSDLDLKEQLDLFPEPDLAVRAREARDQDRQDLGAALHDAGLVKDRPANGEELFLAAHAFLARTESALALVQLDDITDESAPVNVPTTSTEHPNWRRRLSLTVEELGKSQRLARVAEIFQSERADRRVIKTS